MNILFSMQMFSLKAPSDSLKFSSYKTAVNSFDEAVEIIKNKNLVLGEPAVVPYYVVEDESRTIELVFGIGSIDRDNPFVFSSVEVDSLREKINEVEADLDSYKEICDSSIHSITEDVQNIKDIIKWVDLSTNITSE